MNAERAKVQIHFSPYIIINSSNISPTVLKSVQPLSLDYVATMLIIWTYESIKTYVYTSVKFT